MVVLTATSAGDAILTRLLAASGTIRVSGRPLAHHRVQPLDHLRRLLVTAAGESVHAAFIKPTDFWLSNNLDPDAAVRELGDTIALVTLARIDSRTAGASALLDPCRIDSLPAKPAAIDVSALAVAAHHAHQARVWLDAVPNALHLRFEEDLAIPEARQATAHRLADFLQLRRWQAPPERYAATTEAVWAAVESAETVKEQLTQLDRVLHRSS